MFHWTRWLTDEEIEAARKFICGEGPRPACINDVHFEGRSDAETRATMDFLHNNGPRPESLRDYHISKRVKASLSTLRAAQKKPN